MTYETELEAMISPLPRARYEVDVALHFIEKFLDDAGKDRPVNLNPDFQRGHVWGEHQQIAYIESLLRGAVSSASLLLQFNDPRWGFKEIEKTDLPREMQCVDGLQRLTAIRRFINGEIKPFGLTVADLEDTAFDVRRYRVKIAVHSFTTRAELLQYYIDLNVGGTPHTLEEIDRVKQLRDECLKLPSKAKP